MACSSYGATIDNAVARNKLERLVNVHSLHHGTMEVSATDVSFPVCNRFIPYDGAGNALFCLSRQ